MQLFYREKGIDTHPPLIILHGLWGASDNWLPVADLLSHRFHVILPDLRNHGCSPHSSLFDYTILSQDTEELIGRLNLPQRPFLAGHSLGGKTLMHLVLKRPEIVEKAAIIDICPQAYTLDRQTMHRSEKLLRDTNGRLMRKRSGKIYLLCWIGIYPISGLLIRLKFYL